MASDGYGMDGAAARLSQAIEALNDVRSRMAGSMKTAKYWRDEFAGHGFEGLGRSCEQIRAAAEAVHTQADSLAAEIGTHTATVTTVIDTTEPEQVIAILTPVERDLDTLSAHCLSGTNRCTDLAALAARNLEGGKPEWLMEQANTAGAHFGQARRHLAAAIAVVGDAIHRAHQAGTAGTTSLSPSLSPPTDTEASVGDSMDPAERTGARIHDGSQELKSKAARFRDVFRDGDTVVEDGARLEEQVRTYMNAKQPNYCVPLADTHTGEIQPLPPERPDTPTMAASIFDTAVFLVDVAVVAYRKGKARHGRP